MQKTSFLDHNEVKAIGFARVGKHTAISRYARFYRPDKIEIGDHVRIDDFCILSGGEGIYLGSCIHLAAYSAIYGGNTVQLEDFVNLSSRVTIYSESDDFSGASMTSPLIPLDFKPGYIRGKVVLHRHAAIGTNSTILPRVTVGEGAAVGAHSLVTEDCNPWGIYAGVPARCIGERSRAILELEQRYIKSCKVSGRK